MVILGPLKYSAWGVTRDTTNDFRLESRLPLLGALKGRKSHRLPPGLGKVLVMGGRQNLYISYFGISDGHFGALEGRQNI